MRAGSGTGPGKSRCAIYTRKSSEEGLEQSFNSLDAQREACAAYILSQASEGWAEVKDSYDDGGLSGGTLERPALKRLIADVTDGKVDIIVVYKVDRLTRSLFDFAKLVETFAKAGTSFVSVTQSFNTTTSMGRLTLNMLLSFAQFEREVTAERIRDKLAASKAKGMWMGGVPPIGYKARERTLDIIPEQAALVRTIFERYLELKNVRLLTQALARDGLHYPRRVHGSSRTMGGGSFTRTQLYRILKNRTYLGEIVHREKVHPGLHPAIIDREVFEHAQQILEHNLQGERTGKRARDPSLLAGLIVDEEDRPLAADHATAGNVRYRYYTSKRPPERQGTNPIRIPAREIEQAVVERLSTLFHDPLALAQSAQLRLEPSDFAALDERSKSALAGLHRNKRQTVLTLVEQVKIERSRITITCRTGGVAVLLRLPARSDAPARFAVCAEVRITRSGHSMRLVQTDGRHELANPNTALVRLVAQGHRYWREIRTGTINVDQIAKREGLTPSYVSRVVRLAFLSPTVVEALLAGKQRLGVDTKTITAPGAYTASWREQARELLPSKTL